MVSRATNEVGKTYGKLFVDAYVGTNKHRAALFRCKCECGNIIITKGSSLRTGETKSCGCFQKETACNTIQKYNASEKRKNGLSPHKKHGMSKTKIYHVWLNMKRRCNDKNHQNYLYYGGRGIKICDNWNNSFESFYDWAVLSGYQDDLTIDRINPNGNYEPQNCRWIPFKEQVNNTRKKIKINIDGIEKSLKQWCEIKNINYKTAYSKYKKGLPINQIFANKVCSGYAEGELNV